ncbi:transcriptional regulator, XRE family with cupin sensor [Gemmobacter megaterium]|uniref:Transcriptional regulator, XRE family with cupin sensor n=1 Tax=Gemmobacter megaterium TaxID=1086013 RepID=A0A1N7NF38_9RHOB|nr:cupin domain-containing protein [Gemmobacter megaterium]GGE14768.1 transcriptional regulator [Gemmobacter megaterium]SIS96984.1 transcriptional regulator, XRE family with cupin sensor [Gemmobacter megaterium]
MNERITPPDDGRASDPHVGSNLRNLRKAKGLSLQRLAEASGVSVGMISQVERGLANPSMRLLTSLRRALNISMQELFGDVATAAPSNADPHFVRRRENRPVIDLGTLHKELLTPTDRHHLQIMILRLEPGGESGGKALSYPAEKGGLVLAGKVMLSVDGEVAEMTEGDSFVFDSVRPHFLRNSSDAPAEVLWIIGAVQFDRHL